MFLGLKYEITQWGYMIKIILHLYNIKKSK